MVDGEISSDSDNPLNSPRRNKYGKLVSRQDSLKKNYDKSMLSSRMNYKNL